MKRATNEVKVPQGAASNVLTFKTITAVYAAVTACVAAAETVKGQWRSMAEGLIAFAGSDKAKLTAIVGDGDGVKESDDLRKAIVAGLPTLSRALLETARADTNEENLEARDAVQANVATYVRRVRQTVLDILDGKAPKAERSEADNVAVCAELAEKLRDKIGKLKGNFSESQMLAGFIANALGKGTSVAPDVIGMAAMLAAKKEAK